MANEERLKQNLKRWKKLNLDAAQKLETLDCKEIVLSPNEDGQLNLKNISNSHYLHSTQSPIREATQWFLSLDLKDVTLLYVYGIGLGYYYDVIKDWLKQDPHRFVIFLDDNLEVIKHFLETERGSDFLKDPQAKLFYFTWDTTYFSFAFITSLFSLSNFKVSALQSYDKADPSRLSEFYARLAYFHDMYKGTSVEFLGLNQSGFIANFYKNLLLLPSSKLEFKMREHFKNVPAIICGAGPSLGKNIHILKKLQDKALIMAGGTAMNVLNGAGINPHFGLGIDPNPSHYNRLISNTAFEDPFFYRQRMYSRALKVIHGEHLFVTGAGGYRLPAWFEDRLEIPKAPAIEEGHNVVNFNLSIAKELGCNPILIVGVDLAYSDNLSYAPGLVRHAIHDPKEAFLTKSSHEELLIKNDINGVPVNTLWKWVNESLWFSQFAQQNPEITILNCTEGGIGFSHVPNMKLNEAADQYLKKTFDFASFIHGEIQNSEMPKTLTKQKVIENFQFLIKSLLFCENYLSSLMLELGKHFQNLQNDPSTPLTNKNSEIDEFLSKLEAEEAFKHLLQDYKERFLEIFFPRLHFLENDSELFSEKDIVSKRIFFDISLYTFLSKVARHNINLIQAVLNEVNSVNQKPVTSPPQKTITLQEKLKKELEEDRKNSLYSFENNCLQVRDPLLNINYKKSCECGVEKSYYPEGQLKTEVYRLNKQLHGPATFYAENGQILSQNWYIDGKLDGKGCFYYPTGELYAIKRYKEGLLHNRQEFYYRNGLPKSLMNYDEDLIDQDLLLFYENGKIKREMHFVKGKKHGLERMWSDDGMLMLEASYDQNIPCATAREWYPNGNLAKEIKYEEDSDEWIIKLWSENGAPISIAEVRGKDYFDTIADHSKSLNAALQNIYKTLVNIAPSIPEESSPSIEADLLALKQEMEKLNKYNHELLILGGYEGKNPREALWKTPEVEKMMKAQMADITKKLTKEASETQANMKDLFEKINQMKQLEDNSNNTQND